MAQGDSFTFLDRSDSISATIEFEVRAASGTHVKITSMLVAANTGGATGGSREAEVYGKDFGTGEATRLSDTLGTYLSQQNTGTSRYTEPPVWITNAVGLVVRYQVGNGGNSRSAHLTGIQQK